MHMNGRRSTSPSGSASDEGSARGCKPAVFALSAPSGEGVAGDGGFLPKLSRRRFPSPFSLSRSCCCSIARPPCCGLARGGGGKGGCWGGENGRWGGETGGCEKRKGETTSHAGCAYTIVHPKTNRYTTEQHTSRAGTRPTPYSYHTPPSKNGDTDQESYSSRRCGLRLDGDERKTAWQAGGLAQKRSVGVDGAPSGIIGHLLEHRDAAQAAHLFLVPAEQGGELSCRRGAR